MNFFHYVGLDFYPKFWYSKFMTQTKTPLYVDELIMKIYEDNYSHFDFIENMNGGDCDCNLHFAINLIYEYVRD